MSRILAIDYGTARVGTAISDETETLARPLVMIQPKGPRQIVQQLANLARENEAAAIVMGWPLNLDGQPGEHAAVVKELAERLKERLGVPVHLWDERFTTALAERSLLESGQRGKKRRDKVDCAAATVLLQSFLDSRQRT